MRRALLLSAALLLSVALLLPALAAPARADPPGAFLERARRYHAEDQDRLPTLRAELAREAPDLFTEPLPTCPLRSALAKAFSPAEARALLVGTLDDEETAAVVIDNLAARPDLGALVLASGAVDRLETTEPRLLSRVALNALLDGDDRLARRLLEGPALEKTADELTHTPHPAGLRWLADVVTGAVPLSEAVRARLALVEPDVYNARPTISLGASRVAALRGVARAGEDPALRALAARLLLRANDPAIAAETVRAFVEARSAHLDDQDWHHLGKLAPLVVADPRVAIEDRITLFESWFLWTWVRAEEDRLGAERLARSLRATLAGAEARFYGEAIVLLADHDTTFVTTTHARKRPVPSMLGILDDLEAGRAGDAPELTALGREAAARLRAVFAEEQGYPEVRIEDRPLVAETRWRPAPSDVDTALAGVAETIDGVEAYARALAHLADATLPPASRLDLFDTLHAIARDGEPPPPWSKDGEVGFDRRYFARLAAWLVERAGSLDGGLAEFTIGAILDRIPEGEDETAWGAFERAVDTVQADGPRRRLEALRERVRAQR